MKIKVTGYLDTDDMDSLDVDESHPMGVSQSYYEAIATGARVLPALDDVEFEAEPDEEPKPEGRAKRYAKKAKKIGHGD